MPLETISKTTCIDIFFLNKLKKLADYENSIEGRKLDFEAYMFGKNWAIPIRLWKEYPDQKLLLVLRAVTESLPAIPLTITLYIMIRARQIATVHTGIQENL